MTSIPLRAPGSEPVLSLDQERFWLEHLLRPHAAYTIHGRKRLRGALDVASLQRSVAAVVARHEALRTRFPLVEHRPIQVVDPPGESGQVEFADVSTVTNERDREAAATGLANDHATAVFDLAHGSLFRCLLIRLDHGEHLLSITMHHIVADAWSIDLFIAEVAELYRVRGDVTQAHLPALPIQYLDYAAWQRSQLTGTRLEQHLTYWRCQLAGAPPALDLPVATRRTAQQGAVGGRVHKDLTAADVTSMYALCRAHGVTPFMLLLAVLAAVLARWSGRPDTVIGVPTTVRDDGSTQHLIGLFINTLPMRVNLSDHPTFAQLLKQVQRVVLGGAVEHREAPLNVLLAELNLPRDPTRTPLVQVGLSIVKIADRVRVDNLVVESAEAPVQPSTFDLNLFVRLTPNGVRLDPTFHADRYDPRTIRTLLDQMVQLLRAVATNSNRGTFDYPLDNGPRPADATEPADTPPEWAMARFELTATDRFAGLSRAPGMVASAKSMAHKAGATVCLSEDLAVHEAAAVVEWLGARDISVVHLDAPVLRAMAALDLAAPLPALRYAFVHHDGDLMPHDVAALARLAPGCRMVVFHQVSSTGRPLTVYEVPATQYEDQAPLRLPLGVEVDGGRVELRNAAGGVAATCEVGEVPGTGVSARRLPNGTLELVDLRPDGDLLEAVAALRDRPDVDDALVTELTGTASTAGLAAYVASQAGPDPAVLRQYLLTHVRATLVPRVVTVLHHLPLTQEGGYDLAALPSPVQG